MNEKTLSGVEGGSGGGEGWVTDEVELQAIEDPRLGVRVLFLIIIVEEIRRGFGDDNNDKGSEFGELLL